MNLRRAVSLTRLPLTTLGATLFSGDVADTMEENETLDDKASICGVIALSRYCGVSFR
jgi:hypothetical protein